MHKIKTPKINYGEYWQPLYLMITNIFNYSKIPFVDDFIQIIDKDNLIHGGEDILVIASLEICVYTNYIRYSNKGKYIYIHTQYIIFRNYVININNITNIYKKPIDLHTFESANILSCFTPLHHQYAETNTHSENTHNVLSQQKINTITEKIITIRNALDELIFVLQN